MCYAQMVFFKNWHKHQAKHLLCHMSYVLSKILTVCRVCSEGVLCMRMVGCGLRVGLGEAELARGTVGMLSCSILLERPPFTSLPTLFRPMEEKKRRRKSFGRPSIFL